jgi:acetyl-CoA acyltransferase
LKKKVGQKGATMGRQVQEVYIVSAVRTPVGKAPRGMFKNTRSDDLLVHVLQAALAQAPGLDPAAIDDVVVGCAFPEAEQGMNMARIALLLAGLPNTVAGMTVNRFCASGLAAIGIAANRIATGEAEVMLAAGAESMSLVPMMGNQPSFNPKVLAQDEYLGIAYGMGLTAEKVATQWGISRQAQDEFAYQSHQKAFAAQAQGEWAREIAPYTVRLLKPNLQTGMLEHSEQNVAQDEGPRADTTAEALAKLKPVFAAKGSVTAGNSSQMSDGAAALLLASEDAVKRFNLPVLARWCGMAVRGVAPEMMGIGPQAAIPAVLQQVGIQQDDLDWVELNEAFAAQALAVMGSLGLNPAVINPLGGAIALGHPLGATGAIRAATVVHALQRRQLKYGMVTMCIGTGMGAAGVFERV